MKQGRTGEGEGGDGLRQEEEHPQGFTSAAVSQLRSTRTALQRMDPRIE